MFFKKTVRISQNDSYRFWRCIEVSHTIEKMYEESGNVLIRLVDKEESFQMIYFKAVEGRGMRILDESGNYSACLWLNRRNIGGTANGPNGKKHFDDCLIAFREAIEYGDIEIIAERSPYLPSEHVPVTRIEHNVKELLEQGLTEQDILQTLELDSKRLENIKKSMKKKGIIKDDGLLLKAI